MADADWDKIRMAYIRGKIKSYKKLSEKFGVSLNTIEGRAKKEKWVEQRRQYHGRVAAKSYAQAQARDVKRLSALQSAGTEMCAQLEALMQNAQKELHTHVGMFGEVVTMESINDKKMLNITRSIKTMAEAMRDLYDIQSRGQAAQLEMAREELALKTREQERKEKADGEKGQAQEIKITYQGVEDMEAYHD